MCTSEKGSGTDPHIQNVCTEECHCSWNAVFGHCGFSCCPILIPVFWHLWLVLTNCDDTVSPAGRLLPSCWCYANHFPLSQALSLSEVRGFVPDGMRLFFSHLLLMLSGVIFIASTLYVLGTSALKIGSDVWESYVHDSCVSPNRLWTPRLYCTCVSIMIHFCWSFCLSYHLEIGALVHCQ